MCRSVGSVCVQTLFLSTADTLARGYSVSVVRGRTVPKNETVALALAARAVMNGCASAQHPPGTQTPWQGMAEVHGPAARGAPDSDPSAAVQQARLHSLNMNNIFFYVVYSQHDGFVWMLISKMIRNVQEYYAEFPTVVDNLEQLCAAVTSGKLAYRVCVVIFFFLLTIDTRMRHWILDSEQSPEDAAFRRTVMQNHVELVPHARAYLQRKDERCFLGQRATFLPLDPHVAVAVLLPLSDEAFFETICNGNDVRAFQDTFERIERLVLFA